MISLFTLNLLSVCILGQDFHDGLAVKPSNNLQVIPELVPFGHIFKDGIDDPNSGFKAPYDLLELSMRFPSTHQEQEQLVKELPKHRVQKVEKIDLKAYLNPRDMYLHDLLALRNGGVTEKTVDDVRPQWFNFERIQHQNIVRPRPKVMPASSVIQNEQETRNRDMINESPDDDRNTRFFSRATYDLLSDIGGDKINWTTCEEFGKGLGPKHMFHPNDIVDINWEPFYVWAYRKSVAFNTHRFTFPTKKTVKEYMDTYGRHLNQPLDWEQPKLLLTEQMEILLIAADRNGLFHGIPKRSLPLSIGHKNLSLPMLKLHLKIEDPYLALMYCDDFYATIMATPGNAPEDDQEKEQEASVLKFKGNGYPISKLLN